MTYRLFLDDERLPAERSGEWVVARTYAAAVDVVSQRGLPCYISFDHDLGVEDDGREAPTGYDFAKWLGDYILDHRPDVSQFAWYVHSQNPIGAQNIDRYLGNLIRAIHE